MSRPLIDYREAGLEDVSAIAQVNSDTLRECGLVTADIYDVEWVRNRWDGYVRRTQHPRHALEPRILFAALADGCLVGYIAGHFSRRYGTQGELQSIYVLRDHQRLGIGTALRSGWRVGSSKTSGAVSASESILGTHTRSSMRSTVPVNSTSTGSRGTISHRLEELTNPALRYTCGVPSCC